MFEKKEKNNVEDKKKGKKGLWEKFFNKDMVKKGKTAIVYLKNNGTVELLELASERGFFNIGGKTYNEDRDCIYTVTKDRYPLAIIPEWSMIPYGTKTWHDKPMIEKCSELQDHCIRGIRHAELVRMGDKGFSKMNNKTLIVIAIIVIIGIAFLMNGF